MITGVGRLLLFGLPLLAGAAWVASRRQRPPGSAATHGKPLERLLAVAGYDQDWRRFWHATAAGESGHTPRSYLGRAALAPPNAALSPSIARLGERAYEAGRSAYASSPWLSSCPWPADRYAFVGGEFQQIAAYAMKAFEGTSQACMDPWSLLESEVAVVTSMEQARRILGHPSFAARPTWANLRAGWGAIANLDDDAAIAEIMNKRNGFGEQLDALGVPRSWANERVTSLPPRDPVALLGRLRASANTSTVDDGVRTFAGLDYREAGSADAPLVIALHDADASPLQVLGTLRARLPDLRLVVPIGPSMDGVGVSWWPSSSSGMPASPTDMGESGKMASRLAAWIAAFVQAQPPGAKRPLVLGHGQGGVICYWLAFAFPGLARAVLPIGAALTNAAMPSTWGAAAAPPLHGVVGELDPVRLAQVETSSELVRRGAHVTLEIVESAGRSLAQVAPAAAAIVEGIA